MVSESPIANIVGWPEAALSEITIKIGSGATPRGGSETYLATRTEYALIRSQNVFDRRFDRKGLAYITNEQAAELRGVVLQQDDVLLNITGDGITFGRACIVPDDVRPACVNQHVSIIRADKRKVDPGYILAFLTHPDVKLYIESFNAGGSRRAITKGHIESFRLPLPPVVQQRAIAQILGTIDDKIELNRKMNATLESMARALFKSWFVDFDPVRAKSEGRTPAGMDADTAKLFPSEFVESEVGPIPKGWERKTLREAAELNPTRHLRKGVIAPYVEMSSLPTSGHRPSQWPLRELGSGAKFQNGDTLLARITPCLENGKTGFVDFLAEGQVGWGSTEYIVIGPRAPFPPEWGYLLARDENFRDFAAQKMEGSSGRQRVPVDALGQYLVTVPSQPIATRFGQIVQSWFRRIKCDHEQSSTLARLRDELLPRLLSGTLSVDAADREAEAYA